MRCLSWIVLLALAAHARADGEGCGEGEEPDDEASTIEESDGTVQDGPIDLGEEEDKPPQPPAPEDPRRPPPVQVGEWQPPPLDEAGQARRRELAERTAAMPEDPAPLYALAEFDLEKGWLLQAEQEFLRCAELDPESIRPFEGLLRVYRATASGEESGFDTEIIFIGPNGRVRIESRRAAGTQSWLPDAADRRRRIARAYEELLVRRPDHLAARREYVAHLVAVADFAAVAVQARALLEQVPGDADMRYQLAEALRYTGDRQGAVAALEKNLREAPDHAPSLLRLARLLAQRDGGRAHARILDLERRGFYHLFLPREVGAAPFREDTFELALALSGPAMANRLWDEAMRPAERRDGGYRLRWIFLAFPSSLPGERLEAVATLGRRSDPAAVGALLGLLWHMEDAAQLAAWGGDPAAVEQIRALEEAAFRAASGQGTAYYAAAERFLKAAAAPAHRDRAVRLLLALRDPRAVDPLLGALAWEFEPDRSYGVAAALERLGDPRAIDALVDAALDGRRPVPRRVEAAEALGAFRDARAIETLSRLEKEEEFLVACAYGLYRLTGEARHAETLRVRLGAGDDARRTLELVRRCPGEGVLDLLLHAVRVCPDELRDEAIREVRARAGADAEPRLRALLLELARGAAPSPGTLRHLGELGGAEAAQALLQIAESATGDKWEGAVRALADTGDPAAVRYLERTRVVEKDPARRRLAEELAPLAARRRAERGAAAAGG